MSAANRVAGGLLLMTLGCGAPASEPATGALAADVERAIASGTATFDHSVWDALLGQSVEGGLVDYALLARATSLDGYLAALATVDVGGLAAAELKALLLNAYNALTVRAILDHPGVASIREIDGVWTSLEWVVGGHQVTLDNIEHNLLRPYFRDPRIHFAVNCASRSCAPLPPWAFRGDALEAQLEERTRSFLSDSRNVRVSSGALRVSRYFDWYGEDFTAPGWAPRATSIPEFIARYSTPEVGAAVSGDPGIGLEFAEYDWSLNSVSPPAESAATGGGSAAGPAGLVTRLRAWVAGFGVAAPLVYGLAYVIAVVLLVPASALTIGAGVTFGLGVGTITVVLSATTGACLAFLIARFLLRERVERWLSGRERLSAVDRAVGEQGWRVVALTRLSPAFPFNVQNYFYGLTRVPFSHYALASLFAMVPGTLLYVYIGLAGAEVAAAAGGAASWGRTALLVAGLLATLLVVALVTRVARKELDKATAAGGSDPGSAAARA